MNIKLTKSIVGPSMLVLSMAMTGTTIAASDYYEFSTYAGLGSEYDVGSYGNTIYYGGGTAVYSVDVSIADTLKKDEPRFLADGVTANPNYQARIFTNAQSITLSGLPTTLSGLPTTLNGASVGEMYIDATSIYTTGGLDNNQVYAFNKTTGAYTSQVVTTTSSAPPRASLLSYGGGKWWMANENREVWSSTGGEWSLEFEWANMAGSHGDGMEWVNGYIFVSDMTSNFIAQWQKSGGVWTEKERFAYTEVGGTNKYVEGMGFGALDHFWAGSGGVIYELGGGEIQASIDPTIPEPGMLLLFGTGLLGLLGLRRRRSV